MCSVVGAYSCAVDAEQCIRALKRVGCVGATVCEMYGWSRQGSAYLYGHGARLSNLVARYVHYVRDVRHRRRNGAAGCMHQSRASIRHTGRYSTYPYKNVPMSQKSRDLAKLLKLVGAHTYQHGDNDRGGHGVN